MCAHSNLIFVLVVYKVTKTLVLPGFSKSPMDEFVARNVRYHDEFAPVVKVVPGDTHHTMCVSNEHIDAIRDAVSTTTMSYTNVVLIHVEGRFINWMPSAYVEAYFIHVPEKGRRVPAYSKGLCIRRIRRYMRDRTPFTIIKLINGEVTEITDKDITGLGFRRWGLKLATGADDDPLAPADIPILQNL